MICLSRAASFGLLLSCFFTVAGAQKNPHPAPKPAPPVPSPKDPSPGNKEGPQKTAASTADASAEKPSPYRPYKDVITKDAVTQEGLFKVHRIDDHIFFEIPADKLGKPLLWQTEVAELPQNEPGYPGTSEGTRVIRFTRRGTKMYLRNVSYDIRSASEGATKIGVEATSVEPILQSFEIQAEGDNKSSVIEVTNLLTSDPPDFSAKEAVGGAGVDPSRSYVDRVKAFPTNIEVVSNLTYIVGGLNPFSFGGPSNGASSATASVHYSIDALPETPMQGRLADSRIGFFTQAFTEYGRPESRSVTREYIDRFRLEKKDPTSPLSEPVKPITYYLSREVPEKWRPYLKSAVEAWNVAFEQAGFKNAIKCVDAPSKKDDPDWDPEDARYSVIRWIPSSTENAIGPSIQDPRSGETLSAHIIVWNDILRIAESWYFAQCALVDPRAQKLPLSDVLMGEIIRYVVTHEVGHTLGLRHNFKASSFYTVAQLRDPKFVEQNGLASSIMDYSRFNYVAQPGDAVATIGKIGPYDKFAIEYGYKPIPAVRSPDEEKPLLDAILGRQVDHPELRYGETNYFGIDPSTQTEDIGSDPIEAGTLGLKNIDAIASKLLIPATVKNGEDYSRLAETHAALIEQRLTEMGHVISLVGGVVETDYHGGRGGDVFSPVPSAKQANAVKFLLSASFSRRSPLYSPKILNLITPTGILNAQLAEPTFVIRALLNENRLKRMVEMEAYHPGQMYSVRQLTSDISNVTWSELNSKAPVIDTFRRMLQRSYLRTIDGKINGSSASQTDLKALERDDLRALAKKMDVMLPNVKDSLTALHLSDCRKDIESILENKYANSSSGGGSLMQMLFGFSPQHQKDLMAKTNGCFSEAGRFPAWMMEELLKPF